MKRCITGLLAAMYCCGAWAAEGFRVFTDNQGRAIMLKVVGCDLKHDQVTVELEDERRMTVKISGFSESDQVYVKEWFMANELISDRYLKIACDYKTVDKRKEEVLGYRFYVGSTDREEVVLGHKRYQQIAYDISFENKTSQPIKKARIEYKIYYEQKERAIDSEPKQLIFSGETNLPLLDSKGKVVVRTKTVEIYDDDLPANNYYTADGILGSMESAEGDVHGMRGRLIVTLSDDKEVVREFQHPSSLSEKKYPW